MHLRRSKERDRNRIMAIARKFSDVINLADKKERLADSIGTDKVIVACHDDDKALGFVYSYLKGAGHHLYKPGRSELLISALCVDKEHHRKGAGKALLGELINSNSHHKITCAVDATNKAGMTLLQKLGFKVYGKTCAFMRDRENVKTASLDSTMLKHMRPFEVMSSESEFETQETTSDTPSNIMKAVAEVFLADHKLDSQSKGKDLVQYFEQWFEHAFPRKFPSLVGKVDEERLRTFVERMGNVRLASKLKKASFGGAIEVEELVKKLLPSTDINNVQDDEPQGTFYAIQSKASDKEPWVIESVWADESDAEGEYVLGVNEIKDAVKKAGESGAVKKSLRMVEVPIKLEFWETKQYRSWEAEEELGFTTASKKKASIDITEADLSDKDKVADYILNSSFLYSDVIVEYLDVATSREGMAEEKLINDVVEYMSGHFADKFPDNEGWSLEIEASLKDAAKIIIDAYFEDRVNTKEIETTERSMMNPNIARLKAKANVLTDLFKKKPAKDIVIEKLQKDKSLQDVAAGDIMRKFNVKLQQGRDFVNKYLLGEAIPEAIAKFIEGDIINEPVLAALSMPDVYNEQEIFDIVRSKVTAKPAGRAIISNVAKGENFMDAAIKEFEVADEEDLAKASETIANDFNHAIPEDLKASNIEFHYEKSSDSYDLVATWDVDNKSQASLRRLQRKADLLGEALPDDVAKPQGIMARPPEGFDIEDSQMDAAPPMRPDVPQANLTGIEAHPSSADKELVREPAPVLEVKPIPSSAEFAVTNNPELAGADIPSRESEARSVNEEGLAPKTVVELDGQQGDIANPGAYLVSDAIPTVNAALERLQQKKEALSRTDLLTPQNIREVNAPTRVPRGIQDLVHKPSQCGELTNTLLVSDEIPSVDVGVAPRSIVEVENNQNEVTDFGGVMDEAPTGPQNANDLVEQGPDMEDLLLPRAGGDFEPLNPELMEPDEEPAPKEFESKGDEVLKPDEDLKDEGPQKDDSREELREKSRRLKEKGKDKGHGYHQQEQPQPQSEGEQDYTHHGSKDFRLGGSGNSMAFNSENQQP